MKTKTIRAFLCALSGAILLGAVGIASAAAVTVNLTVQRMNTTLSDGATVPMWGYCTTGSCSGNWAPGPTIKASVGDTLTINLTNSLPVSTSLVILGQLGGGLGAPTTMASPQHAPQTQTTWPANALATFTPPAQNSRVMSMGTNVPGTTSASLTWRNLKPGTYLYETGTLASIQVPMGLYGLLVVTAAPDTSGALPVSQAYNGVKYDSDTTLLFSEVDPVQNAAVDAAVVAAGAAADALASKRFNDSTCMPKCYPAAVNYTPTYFLINGHSFNKAAPNLSSFAVAGSSTAPGSYVAGNVLLRLANAGSRTHVPTLIGLPMAIVAEDGNLAPGNAKVQSEVLLSAGKTHDVVIRPAQVSPTPASGAVYAPASYSLFDRNLKLSAGGTTDAGMQGFVQVAALGATSGAGALPAAVRPLAVNDSFQVPLNASISGNVKFNDIAVATVATLTIPAHGTLVFSPDGNFIYTANAGFAGVDSFTYNGNGGTTNTVNAAPVD